MPTALVVLDREPDGRPWRHFPAADLAPVVLPSPARDQDAATDVLDQLHSPSGPAQNADYALGDSSMVRDNDVHMRAGRRLESLTCSQTVGRRCGAVRASLNGLPRAQTDREMREAVAAQRLLASGVSRWSTATPEDPSRKLVTSPRMLEVLG